VTTLFDYLVIDNILKSFYENEKMWDEWDIKEGNEIIFTVGLSGEFLYLELQLNHKVGKM